MSIILLAVQHERAPRSCISNHQTNAALAASTLDLYSVQRRLPLHPSSIVHLPMPMHLPLPTAFAPLDAHRYLPSTAAAGPYHPPSFLDTLHYGSSVFNAPALRTFQPPAATKASDGLFVQPTPTRPLPKNGECTIAKEDEVTSSEETKLMDMPNYLPSAFSHTYSLERETISESAAKLLFLAVKWAKSVPSFNHILPRDQNILIEETWAELFVITSAQYGLPVESMWTLDFKSVIVCGSCSTLNPRFAVNIAGHRCKEITERNQSTDFAAHGLYRNGLFENNCSFSTRFVEIFINWNIFQY